MCVPMGLSVHPPPTGSYNSLKTFSRQRRIVRGVVFCAVRVVSQESRRLILLRMSRFLTSGRRRDTSFKDTGEKQISYEDFYLLGYNAMQFVESQPIFRRNMSPPS
jgi:hypothetical protein